MYSPGDIECLRNDLHKLCHWSEEWLTLFKVMYFGHNNAQASYYIESTLLPTCTVERDLGVLIQNSFKVSELCTKVGNTANRILNMIIRTLATGPVN